jgi:UDP-N-acetylglucosamine/UDP-N-acetylgalactosamine 4-epimerase
LNIEASIKPLRFLVTGAAGFIGSNIVGYLLKHRVSKVVAIDNLVTGDANNLTEFHADPLFTFHKGDITDADFCKSICKDIDVVLHQAALGSVPRSIKFPQLTHDSNVNGFLNMLDAARDAGVKRFVYASSSSVYGDSKILPKQETVIGKPLSPYAVTKRVNELYSEAFHTVYGMELIGLRYFNIFGPKQNPNGEYAAAIPQFILALLENKPVYINGDGEQTRDFTYVDNAVLANILSAIAPKESATAEVYNIACGSMISLNELVQKLKQIIGSSSEIVHREPRQGDIRQSLADISKAKAALSFEPVMQASEGLEKTVAWFKSQKK